MREFKLLFLRLLISVFLLGSFSLPSFAQSLLDKPVVIAVIDDGFRVNHDAFDGFRWLNKKDQANNGIDDDANGYIDDSNGWDVSDLDNDVLPPASRYTEFYHGTNMAGVISKTLLKHYGKRADYPVKLMFIKAVSDSAPIIDLRNGYQGIDYAIDNGADIISLSWNGGELTKQASNALARAQQEGIIVVSSMGNFYMPDLVYPSAHSAVVGVSGVDENNKLNQSNYGAEADVVALSTSQTVANVIANDAYQLSVGVSNATAIVAAEFAILKQAYPLLSQSDLKHCLMSTADSVDELNSNIAGQLGAGKTQLNAALDCASTIGALGETVRSQPKGSIYYHPEKPRNKQALTWSIKPNGEYAGIVVKPFFEGKPSKSELKVVDTASGDIVWQGLLTELPPLIESKNSAIHLELKPNAKKQFGFGVRYATQNINFSERFCKGQVVISGAALIEDGSADKVYAANSDCKWLIKPIEGHDIGLTFLELDTEINTDSVYLFSGEKTRQSDFLARVSGNKLPHKMIVEGTNALLWFVSNDESQGQGFKVRITNEPKAKTE